MVPGRGLATAACTAGLVLGASACGSSHEKKLDIPESDASTATTSSPSAGASGDALQTEYPQIGLSFVSLPSLKGGPADALRAYVGFARGHSTMIRSGKVNGLLTSNAAGSALASERRTATYLAQHNGRFAGSLAVEVKPQGSNARTVSFDVCVDGSKLTMTENGRPGKIDGPKRTTHAVSVQHFAGRWKVVADDTTEQPC